MSDLERAKGLIANGDKANAMALLASILVRDRDQLEAWVLLGDMIDDPSRKKDCYNQVLRLAPRNFHALTKLQELQGTDGSPTVGKRSTGELRRGAGYIPSTDLFPQKNSTNGAEIISYVIGGIAAFFVIVYVISSPGDASSTRDSLYVGLIFLSVIAAVIILSVANRRGN